MVIEVKQEHNTVLPQIKYHTKQCIKTNVKLHLVLRGYDFILMGDKLLSKGGKKTKVFSQMSQSITIISETACQ